MYGGALALALCSAVGAQEMLLAEGPDVYKRMSIEELMQQEVTTASRKAEKWSQVASSTHVITADDIRRSGATSIPELLRYSPGLMVARVNTHTWAITARGFNATTANKLQVLMDGRRLYSPLFSGVFWDAQDTLLEDIDRIEVVRGPGGAMWGANAVNGVINIITKSAKDTQGGLLLGGAGTEERGFGGVRYGGEISDRAFYRVYAKYFDRDDSALPSGAEANDSWRQGQTGFRIDWEANDVNAFTFQGDSYFGEKQEPVLLSPITGPTLQNSATDLSGANLIGRWKHTFSESSDMVTQLYYDHVQRDIEDWFAEERHTVDADWQHRFGLGERNDLLWGLNYTVSTDDIQNTPYVAWQPEDRTLQVISAFMQDDITLLPDLLHLTLGTKVEHNEYTGVEVQPNVRLAYTPTKNQTIWAGVARAVRVPSRIDTDIQLRSPLTSTNVIGSQALFEGNPNFRSEDVLTFEAGYRVQMHKRVTLDLTAYLSQYDHLRSVEPFAPATVGTIVVQTNVLSNNLEGTTAGTGISLRVEVSDWWRVTAGYTYFDIALSTKEGSADGSSEISQEGSDPAHQVFALSTWDLPRRVSVDAGFRFVDELSALRVPAYTTLDMQLRWRPRENLEVALVGQNLLDNQHLEFSSLLRTEIQRSVYGKVTWRF